MSDDRPVGSEGVTDADPLKPDAFRLAIGPDNSVQITFLQVVDDVETVLARVWLHDNLADLLAENIQPAARQAWLKAVRDFKKSRH